jgi:hypothetical protein
MRVPDDPFRNPHHQPARRMSEAEIRIAIATATQSPSDQSDFV